MTVYCESFFSTIQQVTSHSIHSGEGSERENAAAEKKFEEAQQKGFRPCKLYLIFIYFFYVTN